MIKGYKFGDGASWVDVVDRLDGTSRIRGLGFVGEVDHPHAGCSMVPVSTEDHLVKKIDGQLITAESCCAPRVA